MSKGLIAFIIVAAIGIGGSIVISMRRSADEAHKRKDEILNDFKRVDNSLRESSAGIDSSNRKLMESLRNASNIK